MVGIVKFRDKNLVKVGDKVLKVNGVSVVDADHYDAVEVLKACGSVLVLFISREVTRLIGHPVFDETGSVAQINVVEQQQQQQPHQYQQQKMIPPPITVAVEQPLMEGIAGGGGGGGGGDGGGISEALHSSYNTVGLPNGNAGTPMPMPTTVGLLNGNEITHKVILHTTLIRDQIGQGLGFSIAGGKGHAPFKDGSEGIYISRITEGGVAHKDGKILVGDRVLAINGVDITNAHHDYAVQLLTDHQRFVRLVVQREVKGPLEPPTSPRSPMLKSLNPSGYMANRPAYSGYRRSIDETPEVHHHPASEVPVQQATPHPEVQQQHTTVTHKEVILPKDQGSLGFSIIGGTDHSCTPFGAHEPGIFISHIVPGGIAALSGKLRMGDRILKVNGTDVTSATHQEAVMELLRPCDEIKLTVQHDPLPAGFQEVQIVKQEGERLGMHIKGGLNGQRGNPLDQADEGVFISKINSSGAAKRDGRLRVGQRILEVNGISLLGATHQEAVNSLRSSGHALHLVVCKGYEKGDLLHQAIGGAGGMSTGISNNGHSTRIGSRASETGSELSQSVSSLDRDDSIIAAEPLRKVSVDRVPEERETFSAPVAAPVATPQQQQFPVQPPTTTVATASPQTLSRVAAPNADSQALVSAREKSTPEKVLDIVRAAESLALGGNLIENGPPKSPTEPPTAETLQKTTTIVMSKHTLDTQAPQSPPPAPKTPKSVSDKKRFFENAMEDQTKQTPKPEKVFSFLSQDEVEKLKQEEERKIATLGRRRYQERAYEPEEDYASDDDEDQESCGRYAKADENDNDMRPDILNNSPPTTTTTTNITPNVGTSPIVATHPTTIVHEEHQHQERTPVLGRPPGPVQGQGSTPKTTPISRIPIRTANAEKRARANDMLPPEYDETKLSPSEIRALRAQKRAAWRQARLKSLENDALQAQIMIQTMNAATMQEDASGNPTVLHLRSDPHDHLHHHHYPTIAEHTVSSSDEQQYPRIAPKPIRFPRIAVRSKETGQERVVRETETVLGEKVIQQRTEEVPGGGLRTVEYVEKVIETEVETMREKIIMLELEEPSSGSSNERQPQPAQQQLQSPDYDDSTEPADVSLEDDNDDHPDGVPVHGHHLEEDDCVSDQEPEEVHPLQTIVEVVNPAVSGGDGQINDIIIGRYNDDCADDSFASASSPSTYGVRFSYEEGQYESINDKMKNVLRELKQNEKVRLNLSKSMTEEELAEQEEDDEDDDEVHEYQLHQEELQQEIVHAEDEEDEEFRHYEEKTGAIGTVFMVRERLINDFYTHQSELSQEHHQVQHQQQRLDYYDGCEVIQNPAAQAFEEELEKMHSLSKLQKMTLNDEKLKAVFCDDEDDEEDEEAAGSSLGEVSGGERKNNGASQEKPSGIPIAAGTNGSGSSKRKKRKNKKKK